MTSDDDFRVARVHLLGMAGLGRNVGFGVNKVFAGPFLQALFISQPVIGFVLGLEGLFGLIFNPLTGWLSDRTTKSGFRRKIYVLICLPGAAITWLIFCITHNIHLAIISVIFFYMFQQSSISPYHAWMPELVPQRAWGLASGYLNLWWQLGNLLAFLVIPLVWKFTHMGAYLLTGIIIAGGGLLTVLFVPEQSLKPEPVMTLRQSRSSYGMFFRGDLLLFFISQAFAWLAFESIASFFTLFILHDVHGTMFDSALTMSFFTVAGMIAAILSGKLYQRISPKILLVFSLGFYGILSLSGLFLHSLLAVYIIVGLAGVFWAVNLTVSFSFVMDLLREATGDEAKDAEMRGGLYGFSNLVQSAGLLIAAPVTGLVIQGMGGEYHAMFFVSGAASFLALLFVTRIHAR